jgi:hypothetical protein
MDNFYDNIDNAMSAMQIEDPKPEINASAEDDEPNIFGLTSAVRRV